MPKPPRTDVWLAAALTVACQLALLAEPMVSSGTGDPSRVLLALLTLAMTVPVAWRRVAPLPVLGVAGVAAWATILAGSGISFGALVVWWLTGSAALHTDRRTTAGLVVLGGVAVSLGVWLADAGTRDVLAIISAAGVGTLPPFVGDALRRQRELTAEVLRLRAVELEGAARDERVRIARDLHDTVGHHLGAIGLRARAGELDAGDGDAAAAAEALAAVARLSDRALEDTRVLLGVLRDGDAEGLRPTPGLGDLDELADSAAASGVRVTLERVGDAAGLPDAISTCAFRIVQEALTNTAKHAAPAAARVVVERGGGRVRLTVTDDGPAGSAPGSGDRRGAAPRADGRGLGLAGMRERASAVGGTVVAAPLGGAGGWRVHADLPDAV